MKLTKAQYALLEKVFAAEIGGKEYQARRPSKVLSSLEDEGLVCVENRFLGGHDVGIPVLIPHLVTLTHHGRLLYCQWASEQEGE